MQTIRHLSMSVLLATCGLPGLSMLAGCTLGSDGKTPTTFTPSAAPADTAPALTSGVRRLVILHTNDEHSHLFGVGATLDYPFLPNPDGTVDDTAVGTMAYKIGAKLDTQTQGGIVRRQFKIKQIRETSKDPVLVVSAGDYSMGSIFHIATPLAGPDLVAMALVGYDFVTLGNHELDWGPDQLAASIHAASKMAFGGIMPIVASNIHFDDVVSGAAGDSLKALYGAAGSGAAIVPSAVKVMPNGLRVGIVGLMGQDASFKAGNKAPIAFSSPMTGSACTLSADCVGAEAGFSCVRQHCANSQDKAGYAATMAADIQPIVTALRDAEKVDVVVALSHFGTVEAEALAIATHGIDVIIGGHTHSEVAPKVVSSGQGAGSTIIVQAGSYGMKLGELDLSVSSDGTVSFDATTSTLHEIDYKLDATMLEGTNLTATPAELSPGFKAAVGLTKGLLGPILGQLNTALAPALPAGVTSLIAPIAMSDHDVLGDGVAQDTALDQLVTDAERALVAASTCLAAAEPPMVSVQGHGVIRESLRFDASNRKATPADVFNVLSLGASPWETTAAPGYPLVQFYLNAIELYAGLDVGVTQGLVDDDFFLGYAGMKVTYDRTLPPFSLAKLLKGEDPGGSITKIELETAAGVYGFVLYDLALDPVFTNRFRNLANAPINPQTYLVEVISNLYLEGFLYSFGLKPRDAAGVNVELPQTVLCSVALAPSCPATPSMALCWNLPGSTITSWPYHEVKDWVVLMNYLVSPAALNGTVPPTYYTTPVAAADHRVIGL